ncbi:hypothetical protein BDB01DRAFT_722359, partial [Pilobolus umbonatus]
WVAVPVSLQAIFRNRGGYYHRHVVLVLCIGLSALYGVFASITLPLIGKRELINWSTARFHYRLASFFLGITATVEGKENVRKDGPAIYVCNHQTNVDIIFMGAVFPRGTTVVAKKVLKYYPFLGWFMILSKAIFLDRGNRESALKQAAKAAEDINKKQMSVFIFPEGTRSHTTECTMLPFKKGAFYMAVQAGVPVIPIVVSNYHEIYNTKRKRFGHGNVKIRSK